MRKIVVLFVVLFASISVSAHLPNLVGEIATKKELADTYRTYYMKLGSLEKSESGDSDDDYYSDAYIVGSYVSYTYDLYTDRDGFVTSVSYSFNNHSKEKFDNSANLILRMYNPKFIKKSGNHSYYRYSMPDISMYGYITIMYASDLRFGTIVFSKSIY